MGSGGGNCVGAREPVKERGSLILGKENIIGIFLYKDARSILS